MAPEGRTTSAAGAAELEVLALATGGSALAVSDLVSFSFELESLASAETGDAAFSASGFDEHPQIQIAAITKIKHPCTALE
jgi:hypothetical protein